MEHTLRERGSAREDALTVPARRSLAPHGLGTVKETATAQSVHDFIKSIRHTAKHMYSQVK